MIAALITLTFLLFSKHFLVDFPWQIPWHYLNKGKYGHPGGIAHSLGHFAFTGLCLAIVAFTFGLPWSNELILSLALFDGVVHYHIDWAKVRIKEHFGWGPTTHEEFWVLTGLDQYLHALTYIVILVILFM